MRVEGPGGGEASLAPTHTPAHTLRSECSTFMACRWHMALATSSAVSRMA